MPLNHHDYYRLPWTFSDNIISWLEPTKKCNMYCEGCYSANNPASHKTLDQIREDLDVFDKYRTTQTISIAGGEPLTHPLIEEIVRMVAERGFKPILNTNGLALTQALLRKLKNAGLKGLTFHIDSLQKRPDGGGKNELELNELRLHFAQMTATVGGLSCAFNATVYSNTLKYVPGLLEWAHKHIDIVHVMVFITFRAAHADGRFECYAGDKKVEMAKLVYGDDKGMRVNISSNEIVDEIRKKYPDFEPCGYLGGTESPNSFKWLLSLRVGIKDKILGYFGPKFAELAQVSHHIFHGKYLGYIHPRVHARAKWMMAAGIIDKGVGRAFREYLKACLKNPLELFRPVHMQSVMIIQPVDIFDDGRQSMCDGCPDMTVWNGRLVPSCRLEEFMRYGCFLTMVPAKENKTMVPAEAPAKDRSTEEVSQPRSASIS